MTNATKVNAKKKQDTLKDKKNSGHTFGREPQVEEPKKPNQPERYEVSGKIKKK